MTSRHVVGLSFTRQPSKRSNNNNNNGSVIDTNDDSTTEDLSRERVAMLMRQQDAVFLESMHISGVNNNSNNASTNANSNPSNNSNASSTSNANGNHPDTPVKRPDRVRSRSSATSARNMQQPASPQVYRHKHSFTETNFKLHSPTAMHRESKQEALKSSLPSITLSDDCSAPTTCRVLRPDSNPIPAPPIFRRALSGFVYDANTNINTVDSSGLKSSDGIQDVDSGSTYSSYMSRSTDNVTEQISQSTSFGNNNSSNTNSNDVETAGQAQKSQQFAISSANSSDGHFAMMRRTDSMDRRLNEAAQFAEAVGEAPSNLNIINESLLLASSNENEDDDDDSDDDDDANTPQVRIDSSMNDSKTIDKSAALISATMPIIKGDDNDLKSSALLLSASAAHSGTDKASSSLPSASTAVTATPNPNDSMHSNAANPQVPATRKSRPLWPFSYSTRHFLDQLSYSSAYKDSASSTSNNNNNTAVTTATTHSTITSNVSSSVNTQQQHQPTASSSYVYKGICSNPPEIVQHGITRGNYAQLHRKAWLEVSDRYHRYGKHLRLYYRHWESLGYPTNSFFDWLDSKGESAGSPLPEIAECPRAQLDADTVLYITNPDVTAGYAIQVSTDTDGKARLLDVDGDAVETGNDGWIFVLRDNVLYGAQKVTSVKGQSKQRFHHSSFFGGKAVAAAGIFITDSDGYLLKLYPHSGHYRPNEASLQRLLYFLYTVGVDLRTFMVDTQQISHVARDSIDNKAKKKKIDSVDLTPAVIVACFLAHKASWISKGIFAQIHQILTANVTSVNEALDLID